MASSDSSGPPASHSFPKASLRLCINPISRQSVVLRSYLRHLACALPRLQLIIAISDFFNPIHTPLRLNSFRRSCQDSTRDALFIHSFIQQAGTEYSLWVRHSARLVGYIGQWYRRMEGWERERVAYITSIWQEAWAQICFFPFSHIWSNTDSRPVSACLGLRLALWITT